jgi:hypothetical protein
MYNNSEAHSRNICCHGQQYYILCVSVASVTQHAMHIHRTVMSSVTRLAVPYSSTLNHKWHDFRRKLSNIKCVFLFFLTIFA